MTQIIKQWLYRFIIFIMVVMVVVSCRKQTIIPVPQFDTLVIFNINDAHAQINNFDKIKQIVDDAETRWDVIIVSAGDNFSGNPVVDNYPEKGYPFIDLMNRCGFDAAVLGNHEFDYGQEFLHNRIEQSDFPWLCANVDMGTTVVPEPAHYTTIESGDLRVTFVGFVQTSGSPTQVIPSTHPGKLEGITFVNAFDIMSNYSTVRSKENSDLVVALSHMGTGNDFKIAEDYPFFDLIIGGHSHQIVDKLVGTTLVVQAGSKLNWLGKTVVVFRDKMVTDIDYDLIDLNDYSQYDESTRSLIEAYNDQPGLYEVIGYSNSYMSRGGPLGCFYTDILRAGLGTDVSFQNPGGLRSDIDEGDITVYEIYSMSPFNNGANTYTMTVGEIKDFLSGSGAGFYYSGIDISDSGSGGIEIRDLSGSRLPDGTVLTVGINDYIPAVYNNLFPDNASISPYTTAEVIINWLRDHPGPVDYTDCSHYYKY